MTPIITTSPVDQVKKATTDVTFTCTAISNPRAVIWWSFNGNVLNTRSDSNGIKILTVQEAVGDCTVTSQCEISSTLNIFNVQPADSGEYICNISNAAGFSTESAANLTVIGNILE